MNSKVKSQKEIIEIARDLKKQGKRTIALSGSFDILHADHIKSFKEAKGQGDVLIVLLNSDKSIKTYKGPSRPINEQKCRIEVLSAIEYIDYAVVFDEITPVEILSKIQPAVFCQGKEWGKNCIERKAVEGYGGKIRIFKHTLSTSTSEIARKISDVYFKPEIKAVFLDRDGTINATHPGYVRNPGQFKFQLGAVEAIKKLSKTDYKIIVITNQSGIAKAVVSENNLAEIHNKMISDLKRKGGRIDAVYYCPHFPDSGCGCRKPEIGMFLKAAKDFEINLSKSWMVGDEEKDVVAARMANIKAIKIKGKMSKEAKLEPHYYAKDLLGASKIIYARS